VTDLGQYRISRFHLAFVLVAVLALVGIAAPSAQGQTFNVLYNFTSFEGSGSDGGQPYGGLIQDAQGNLYGTTLYGGGDDTFDVMWGMGTVYKISPDGTETVLHSFQFTDGEYPTSTLVRDSAGNLYGTTQFGGYTGNSTCEHGDPAFFQEGCGTIFKLDPSGNLTTLYTFHGLTDGYYPNIDLIDASGNLYGTVVAGGNNGNGFGEVWKLNTTTGALTILHTFLSGSNDGDDPSGMGNLIAKGSTLYGTTLLGGAANCGVVYKMSNAGKSFKVLYSFQGAADGCEPAGLTMDSKGNFYGVTEFCGSGGGIYSCVQGGTLWTMTSAGVETVLHSFAGAISTSDGYLPVSAPVWDAAGNLWGTTDTGGAQNGTIYEWSAQGEYSVPFILPISGADGSGLASPLLLGSNGSFYGSAIQGGTGLVGLAFEFTPPLQTTTTAITKNAPNPSKVGQAVTVSFTVAAPTAVKATKPTGSVTVNASTGQSCTGTIAVASGKGSCKLTFTAEGSPSLTATYSGDKYNSGSVSAEVTQTVN
jgi:uncharacterized repeat protein (TIGR03803 family)